MSRNTKIMFLLFACFVSFALFGCDDGDSFVGSGLGGEVITAVADDIANVADSPAGNAVRAVGDALPENLSADVADCVVNNNCGK